VIPRRSAAHNRKNRRRNNRACRRWSRRRAWHSRRNQRRQRRLGNVLREQHRRLGGSQDFFRRLYGGNRHHRSRRQAVAAASAGLVRAVGKQRLAFVNGQRLVGPEDAIADAVRDVDRAVRVHSYDMRLCNVEVGVVRSHDGIVLRCLFQLLRASTPPGITE